MNANIRSPTAELDYWIDAFIVGSSPNDPVALADNHDVELVVAVRLIGDSTGSESDRMHRLPHSSVERHSWLRVMLFGSGLIVEPGWAMIRLDASCQARFVIRPEGPGMAHLWLELVATDGTTVHTLDREIAVAPSRRILRWPSPSGPYALTSFLGRNRPLQSSPTPPRRRVEGVRTGRCDVLRPKTLSQLNPSEFIAEITQAIDAPPTFLDAGEVERRRKAVLKALDGLDKRVSDLIAENRWTLMIRGGVLGLLTLVMLGVTIVGIFRESIQQGTIAGATTFASVLGLVWQIRTLERERLTLNTLVKKREGQLEAATTEDEIKAIAAAVVADLDSLSNTGSLAAKG